MALGRPLLLLLAFGTLLAVAASVEHSGGLNGRRLLSRSTGWKPRRPTQHTFSKLTAHLNGRDYGPPSSNPPVGPPLSEYSSYESFDAATGSDIHTDYAPVVPNPPTDGHDYPPGDLIPQQKYQSFDAAIGSDVVHTEDAPVAPHPPDDSIPMRT